MKNKASIVTLLILGLLATGAVIGGCTGGDAPADTSGHVTPEQAKEQGLPTPEGAVGAGGGGGQAGTMETGA